MYKCEPIADSRQRTIDDTPIFTSQSFEWIKHLCDESETALDKWNIIFGMFGGKCWLNGSRFWCICDISADWRLCVVEKQMNAPWVKRWWYFYTQFFFLAKNANVVANVLHHTSINSKNGEVRNRIDGPVWRERLSLHNRLAQNNPLDKHAPHFIKCMFWCLP